jgi:hypothetical protein
MSLVSMIIDGAEVDLDKDFSPSIQITGPDFEKPFDSTNDFSFTLKLPLTSANIRVFPRLSPGRMDSIGPFAVESPAQAAILVDGLPVLSGTFVVQRVSPEGIEGFLRGEKQAWLSQIGKIKLRELDIKIPFLGGETVENSWQQSSAALLWPAAKCLFAPIGYGRFNNTPTTTLVPPGNTYLAEFAQKNEICSDYTEAGVPGIQTNVVTFEDFPPQVMILSILEAAAARAGYKIGGSFVALPEAKRLVLSYSGSGYIWNWKTLLNSICYYSFPVNYVVPRDPPTYVVGPVPFPLNVGNQNSFHVVPPLDAEFAWGIKPNSGLPPFLLNNYGFQYDETEDEYTCLVDGRYQFLMEVKVQDPIVMLSRFSAPPLPPWGTDPNYNSHIVAVITRGYETLDALNKDRHAKLTDLSPPSGPVGPSGLGANNIIAWDTITPKTAADVMSEVDSTQPGGWFLNPIVRIKSIVRLNDTVLLDTGPIRMRKGDKVRPAFIWRRNWNAYAAPYTECEFKVTAKFEAKYLDGSVDLDLAANLPEKTVQDLLEDLNRIYNIRYSYSAGTIMIDAFNEYVDSPYQRGLDLSQFIDVAKCEKYDTAPPREHVWSYLADEKDVAPTTSKHLKKIYRPSNSGTSQEYKTNFISHTKAKEKYFRYDSSADFFVVFDLPLHADSETWIDVPNQEFLGKDDFFKSLPSRKYDTAPRLYKSAGRAQPLVGPLTGWCRLRKWTQGLLTGSIVNVEASYFTSLDLMDEMEVTATNYWATYYSMLSLGFWIRTPNKVSLPPSVYLQINPRRPIILNGQTYALQKAQITNLHKTNADLTIELCKI